VDAGCGCGGGEGDDACELFGEQAVVGGGAFAVDAVGVELSVDLRSARAGRRRATCVRRRRGRARERPAEQRAARSVQTWLPSRWCSTCVAEVLELGGERAEDDATGGGVEVGLVLDRASRASGATRIAVG
jgi:hypothetical protein